MSYNTSVILTEKHLEQIENKLKEARPHTYYAGVSGTVNVLSGESVTGLYAYDDAAAGVSTVAIGAGANITIPQGEKLSLNFPQDGIKGPVNIVFTGTSSYYVGVESNV